MYSPKINEALVPILYRLGKARRMPMTKLVDELIIKALTAEQLPDDLRAIMPPRGASGGADQAA